MTFKEYKLGNIATFSQGKQVDLNQQYSHYENGLKRFVRIVDYTNDSEPIRYVKDFGKRYFASDKELIMIRYGSQTAGMVAMGKNGIIANNIFKITLDNNVANNKFMYYYLSQKKIFKELRASQSSSTMPAINFGMLNNYSVYVPKLDNQIKIVKILDNISKKIDENNQTNNNLLLIS